MVVVIKMKGLFWEVIVWDIRKFYCGFDIVEGDIYLVLNLEGKVFGYVFVCF